jgi:hypothetical protein
MSDEEFKMWKVDEDSPTIWTSLKMAKTILPSRIEFHQPENQDEMVQKMIVHYSDMLKESITVQKKKGVQNLVLKHPAETMTIKIELEKATASTIAGGSINVFGIVCNDPEVLARKRKEALKKAFGMSDKDQVFTVDCSQTFAGVLSATKPDPGKKFRFNCLSACVDSEAKVIGAGPFSPQSNACKAAFYSDTLKRVDGGMFEVVIGDRQENYKGGAMNKSITPEGNPEGSQWSVTIKALEAPTIKLKKDMEVDVFDKDKCWERATVKEVQTGKAMVDVAGKEFT